MRIRPIRAHDVGRSFRSIILLAVGGSFVLASVAATLLIWPLWSSYRYTNQVVALDSTLGAVTVGLARERGLVATALGAGEPASEAQLADIQAARRNASTQLKDSLRSMAVSHVDGGLKVRVQRVQLLLREVIDLRRSADAAIRLPATRRDPGIATAWTAGMTVLIDACQDMRLAAMRSTRTVDTTFEDLQMLAHFAWKAAEHAGRERAAIGAFLSSERPIDEAEFQTLEQNRGQIIFGWEMAMLLAEASGELSELRSAARAATGHFFVDFERLRQAVVQAGHEGRPYPIDAAGWFAESTAAIDKLLAVETAAIDAATRHRDAAFLRASVAIAGGAVLFVVLTGTAVASLMLFKRRISDPLHQITQATRRFASGDYNAEIPDVLPDSEVAKIASALSEFRDDAVERERLKVELNIARDRAEAANRAKSQFLANMSHELRTPLNAIIGFSELMKAQALGPLGHDKYVEYAGDVHESGRHLLEVINDVLEMARIETQQGLPQEDEIDLAEMASLGVRRIASRAQGLDLQTSFEAPLRVRGDPARLGRVIDNLLSNALKFTGAGGQITVRAYRDSQRCAVVEVQDTGIGMTATEIDRAFEPFYQADSGLNRRHEGTGLGLPLSNAIVRLHGGRIEIDSAPKAGTTVRVILPPERSLD